MLARMACMVEARLAKKRKANLGKASVAPITELATRSTSANGASVDTPATMFIEDVCAILRRPTTLWCRRIGTLGAGLCVRSRAANSAPTMDNF